MNSLNWEKCCAQWGELISTPNGRILLGVRNQQADQLTNSTASSTIGDELTSAKSNAVAKLKTQGKKKVWFKGVYVYI